MRYLILLGAPGSGKGTQAPALAEALKVPHVSSGDLFRENVGKGTELGVLAKTYMDGGELYQRADDNRETAQRRLEVYYKETVPVIEYYKEQGKLTEVQGEGSIDEIGQALHAALEGGK